MAHAHAQYTGRTAHSMADAAGCVLAAVQVGGVLSTGIRFRGLSGGQKKRLNIAAHLVGDPAVVFLVGLLMNDGLQ